MSRAGSAEVQAARAERNARIVALARDGMTPFDIARKERVSSNTVRNIVGKARRGGEDLPRGTPGRRAGQAAVLLRQDTFDRFAAPAAKRGVEPGTLARRILEAVLRDDLIDAVLDDGAGG